MLRVLVSLLFLCGTAWAGAGSQIGVYYFPGWKIAPEIIKTDPWDKIRPYPDREPVLGWYPEGDDKVAAQQLTWMKSAGLGFVVYDWYWLNGHGVSLNQAIDAYRRVAPRDAVQYSILWANHSNVPSSLKQFDDIVDYWIDKYFKDPRFLKIDGKPVVFVFNPGFLARDAKGFGTPVADLLNRARQKARNAGLAGIYFVASTQAVKEPVVQGLPSDSYDALSAYNYHSGLSGKDDGRSMSRSYTELTDGYVESWKWILDNSSLPYILPITSGWDKRPWGGSADRLHDNSAGDPANFIAHLKAAKDMMSKYPGKTMGMGVICCWNEFGEGSYIEPSKKYGFQYLDAIKDVFGKGK
ncbi:glycoside hydrolase family 99-like domain-containing protein [Zoogloea sp.]|uniref:glycoside hydrolase family 99-like domain-containing protein n=1 Tax=Zoogloea sp. TaxID=49181 RepID=UPI001416C822|nr:MAG: hypothetical protein F9K15_19795 [Zoogloea sp.]